MQPTREEADAFEGYEFDWFAQDASGALALFSTAGWGEIPVEVIRHAEAHRTVTVNIAQPSIGTTNVWQDYAQVGLYVFDWQHWVGPYAKEVSPALPIAASLRNAVLGIPELPQLPLLFSEVASVRIERFRPSE
jgi:hypothetical protein